MANKRITSDRFHERMKKVARRRLFTPSNKELAREGGCSEATVEHYIARYMAELRRSLISGGTQDATIGRQ